MPAVWTMAMAVRRDRGDALKRATIGHWTRSQTDIVSTELWRNHSGSQQERSRTAKREGRGGVAEHSESICVC